MKKPMMIISLYIDMEMYIIITRLAELEGRSRTNLLRKILDEKKDEMEKKIKAKSMKDNPLLDVY